MTRPHPLPACWLSDGLRILLCVGRGNLLGHFEVGYTPKCVTSPSAHLGSVICEFCPRDYAESLITWGTQRGLEQSCQLTNRAVPERCRVFFIATANWWFEVFDNSLCYSSLPKAERTSQ